MTEQNLTYARASIINTREMHEDENDDEFNFSIIASNNSLDFYSTHMLPSTLENYARAGQKGVQFLDSHNNQNLGYGRSFSGKVLIDNSRVPAFSPPAGIDTQIAIDPPHELIEAILDIRTVRGINFGGGLTYASTDDFIKAVNGGLARDVSVGFYGGIWTCDICGNNYHSFSECLHIGGMSYQVESNGVITTFLSTISVDNAQLAEVSAVYDGATNGAHIRSKANFLNKSHELNEKDISFLNSRYKLHLERDRQFSTAVPEQTEENDMNIEEFNALLLERGMSDLAGENLTIAEKIERLVQPATDEDTRLMEDGRLFRSNTIETAHIEGVRAFGDAYDKEAYGTTFESMATNVILKLSDSWRTIAAKQFPTNGRVSIDGNESPPDENGRYKSLLSVQSVTG